MPEKNRRLVLAILDYLKVSMDDGTVKADDKEGLEVAGGKASNYPCIPLVHRFEQFNASVKRSG
jgi:Homodimerisation domain of SGTA